MFTFYYISRSSTARDMQSSLNEDSATNSSIDQLNISKKLFLLSSAFMVEVKIWTFLYQIRCIYKPGVLTWPNRTNLVCKRSEVNDQQHEKSHQTLTGLIPASNILKKAQVFIDAAWLFSQNIISVSHHTFTLINYSCMFPVKILAKSHYSSTDYWNTLCDL